MILLAHVFRSAAKLSLPQSLSRRCRFPPLTCCPSHTNIRRSIRRLFSLVFSQSPPSNVLIPIICFYTSNCVYVFGLRCILVARSRAFVGLSCPSPSSLAFPPDILYTFIVFLHLLHHDVIQVVNFFRPQTGNNTGARLSTFSQYRETGDLLAIPPLEATACFGDSREKRAVSDLDRRVVNHFGTGRLPVANSPCALFPTPDVRTACNSPPPFRDRSTFLHTSLSWISLNLTEGMSVTVESQQSYKRVSCCRNGDLVQIVHFSPGLGLAHRGGKNDHTADLAFSQPELEVMQCHA